MKNTLRYILVLIALGMLGVGNVWGAVVTKTVGNRTDAPSSDYATLNAAFSFINGLTATSTDYELKIIANTTETTLVALNPAKYKSVKVYPSVSGTFTISRSNAGNPIIDFTGSANVTIDGRLNQSGSTKSLIIVNTSNSSNAGTSTIRFANSANNIAVKYCTIQGSETNTSSGIILFSTSGSGTGNDNNVIEYNDITSAGTRPINAIYSLGTSGRDNSNNTIQYNNIYNVFNASTASNGIRLADYNSVWTINGNSFYETTSFTPATSTPTYNVINVLTTTPGTPATIPSNITINSNYIGGSAASCGGATKWTKTGAAVNNIFNAINISVATGTASNINLNVINRFDWTNNSSATWTGISIAAGDVNIGTSGGNTIGSATGSDSIKVTGKVGGALVTGISISSAGSVDCQNNIIAGIKADNSTSSANTNFYGIYKIADVGTTTIRGNIIGSNTTNSIHTSSTSSSNDQILRAIFSEGTGTIDISNNTISNLTNGSTNTGSLGQTVGIISVEGTNTISNNTISNLSISAGNTSESETSSVVGIAVKGAGSNTLLGNTVSNLTNSYLNAAAKIYGFYIASTGSSTHVSKNFVHSLSITNSPTNTAYIAGLIKAGKHLTCFNNIISLTDANNINIYGIYDYTAGNTQSSKIYFNTIYIGGTINNAQEVKSAALFSTYQSGTSTRDYRNNIFYNSRSSAIGKNYAIYYATATSNNIIANFNDYFVTGASGQIGYFGGNLTTIADIQAATGQDKYSVKNDPNFVLDGSTVAADYKIGEEFVGVAEAAMGISTDYSGVIDAREYFTMMGAWEGPINKWKGTDSDDWNTSTNWTRGYVPDPDATIYFHDYPVNHCVQDQNRSVMHIFNNTSWHTVLNGKKLTLKGNLEFGAEAKVDASATNSNLEYAGALPQEIKDGTLLNNEVYDLTISNTTDLKLNGTLRLLNTIIPTTARLDANTTLPTVSYAGATAQLIDSVCFTGDKVYDLIIDNATGVSLKTNFFVDHNLTINPGKLLTIPTQKMLTVHTADGSITNDAGASGLVIKASNIAANGSLIFPQGGEPVQATVEMYSKASWNLSDPVVNNRYKWQYFGIPFSTLDIRPTFMGTYVRRWDETGTTTANHWVSVANDNTVSSFLGYEICQSEPKTYSFTGNLENSDFSKTNLAYTATALYPGQHIFANPYTAAINISLLSAKFGANMEEAVYLYNTGSYSQWENNRGDTTYNSTTTTPGQYTVSTPLTAGSGGVPATIPSMQAFLVKAINGDSPTDNSLNFNYVEVVGVNTERQRSPSANKTKSNKSKMGMRIDVYSTHFADKMWIFTDSTCTRKYDRGWDGSKLFGSQRMPQIFAIEPDGNYQINAVADMNNTDIGFQAGEEKEFTMKFTHENADRYYTNITLFDIVAKTSTDITVSGTEYKFTAEPNIPASKRFKIITSNVNDTIETASKTKVYSVDGMVFIQNNSTENGELKLYDVSGRFIQQTSFGANNSTAVFQRLTPGVYLAKTIINGKETTKSLIVR